jgi:uncharacterized OB-fold protein
MSLLGRNSQAPRAWLGNLPVTSRYTAGVAGEKFFRAIKNEGKILGTYCENCDITYVPGRIFCERCMAELDDWQDMGTVGEIFTFTLLFEDLEGTPIEEPIVVAFIRMGDGGLIHQLGELDLEELTIGMPVEAVFKPKSEREGSILDIRYFRPIEE